ncbi:MAG TPA: fatty acyl-AMP ligase [Methylovirgula sp.]|nr:fatty acyl-AMP ligase [Methylovirgula sp.]
MVALLEERARSAPHDCALRFLSDRGKLEAELSFADLHMKSAAVAQDLLARGAQPQDRALLLFPPGIEFLIAWFGCLYANVIAVPLMPPRRTGGRDSSAAIIADCAPRFAFTTSSFVSAIREDMIARFADFQLDWLMIDVDEAGVEGQAPVHCDPSDIAFLQYTSGSTADPKGVMVSHANLIANLEMIRQAFGNDKRSTYLSWVPLYHDMGLILNVLQAIYAGATTILMSPVSFLQRPLLWLRAIADFKAEVAGGPNFAFDHCIARFQPSQMDGVDLSGWKVAFNAAEPVRAGTLARFAETFAPYGFDAHAFHPCYGMAEATVLMSSGPRGRGTIVRKVSKAALQEQRADMPADASDMQPIVGCGTAASGTTIAIVDPQSRQELPPLHIGEIWAKGPHIARGYWRKPEATTEIFGAETADKPGDTWLRSGDLGFLDANGELYIAGRIKDVIIVRGRNYYPQDIEHTAQMADAALRPGFGAAFTITDAEGLERLIIVQEVERTQRNRTDLNDVAGNIREAVAEVHELSVFRVVLVGPGTVPKTTSGKIQRRLTRQLWQDAALEILLQL